MTLDEAIKHCEEVMMENLEKTKDRNASDPIAINCFECADEHRQLAEWLKELKAYREQGGDAFSRQEVLDILKDKWNMFSDANDAMQESIDTIEAFSSVIPQPNLDFLEWKWNDDECQYVPQAESEGEEQ